MLEPHTACRKGNLEISKFRNLNLEIFIIVEIFIIFHPHTGDSSSTYKFGRTDTAVFGIISRVLYTNSAIADCS